MRLPITSSLSTCIPEGWLMANNMTPPNTTGNITQGFAPGPATRLLQDLHEDHVHLVQKGVLPPEAALVRAQLDDEVGDVRLDSLPLCIRQRSPSVLDDLLHDLKGGGERDTVIHRPLCESHIVADTGLSATINY